MSCYNVIMNYMSFLNGWGDEDTWRCQLDAGCSVLGAASQGRKWGWVRSQAVNMHGGYISPPIAALKAGSFCRIAIKIKKI